MAGRATESEQKIAVVAKQKKGVLDALSLTESTQSPLGKAVAL
jgi:hypothetical protein